MEDTKKLHLRKKALKKEFQLWLKKEKANLEKCQEKLNKKEIRAALTKLVEKRLRNKLRISK